MGVQQEVFFHASSQVIFHLIIMAMVGSVRDNTARVVRVMVSLFQFVFALFTINFGSYAIKVLR